MNIRVHIYVGFHYCWIIIHFLNCHYVITHNFYWLLNRNTFFVAFLTDLFKSTHFRNPQITEIIFRVCLISVLNNRRHTSDNLCVIHIQDHYNPHFCTKENADKKTWNQIIEVNCKVFFLVFKVIDIFQWKDQVWAAIQPLSDRGL